MITSISLYIGFSVIISFIISTGNTDTAHAKTTYISNVNIFSTRFEQYFELVHENIKGLSPDFSMFLTFDIINNDLLENINSCTLSDNELDNIIIKYFNDIDLSRNDIEVIDSIDYRDSYELFFKLPIVLFILEYSIKKIMLKERPVK